MLRRSYSLVSSFYDFLAAIYSFGAIARSKRAAVSSLRSAEQVLICGIGSGVELKNAPDNAASIVAIDSSSAMLARAARRGTGAELRCVDFFAATGRFDVIVCPYFLNVFAESEFPRVRQKLRNLLPASGGRLLIADFRAPGSGLGRIAQLLYYTPPRLLFLGLTGNPWHRLYDYKTLLGAEVVREEYFGYFYSLLELHFPAQPASVISASDKD